VRGVSGGVAGCASPYFLVVFRIAVPHPQVLFFLRGCDTILPQNSEEKSSPNRHRRINRMSVTLSPP